MIQLIGTLTSPGCWLLHDSEVDSTSFFFKVLYSARVGREGDDSLCWKPSKRRSFEVKTFYKILLPNVGRTFRGLRLL